MKRYLPFVIVMAVALAAAGSGYALYRKHSVPPVMLTGQPGAEPPNSTGNTSAPVVLEEFGDFQCPPCATLAPIVESLEKSYGRKLRVIFRNHPLAVHKNASAAARAAEAAGIQGRFWEMHRRLYETQSDWKDLPDPRPTFEKYAADLRIDVAKFRADMDGEKVAGRIAADMRRGASLEVTATPSIFINNERVQPKGLATEPLRAAIDAILKKQK